MAIEFQIKQEGKTQAFPPTLTEDEDETIASVWDEIAAEEARAKDILRGGECIERSEQEQSK